MWIISDLTTALRPTAIALGNFDGVHRGHQQVIQALAEAAESYLTVVAFDPHPQEFFTGQARTLLTPLAEKSQQLERLGVSQLVLLSFDQTLAALSPAEFVDQILVQQLAAKAISVGFNFRFGHQRAGNVEDLRAIAANYGIQVNVALPQLFEGERISSSAIRAALEQGDLQRANCLLGRAYTLVGEVGAGDRLGRTLGFPTANLRLPEQKFLPRTGVYAVRVTSDGLEQPQLGVMNIGYRPTVDGKKLVVEAHLLDWAGDLYGRTLTVALEQFLRPEQKFADLTALKAQIQQDCDRARMLPAAVGGGD
ncbi:MAG: bifunctional riboflavin kinase/FAD synthetase [Aphanocapsa sp. GSE-SYN-MK-11-07L]|nr:bifunctional riboflavin kinase/FAD synthetase [Aphanocapsa sp. GSE-SYN-MK-11-07L]